MTKKLPPEVLLARVKMNDDDTVYISEEVLALIDGLVDQNIIEINGGIGEIAEYLSKTNQVYLIEERRLCYVYRNNLFPKSTVVKLNEPVRNLPAKQMFDYAIIHEDSDFELAKSICKVAVINASTMKVFTHEKIAVDNSPETGKESGDTSDQNAGE